MNYLSLLIELISGSFTGYTTNSIAIKMLFKKYGPFGGVIIKTKKDFIKNISKLVEEEIINSNTLSNELNKKEFKMVLNHIIDDLLDNNLYQAFAKLKVKDIPASLETINNIASCLENSTQQIATLLYPITKTLTLEELISPEHFRYIIDNLSKNIIPIIENKEITETLLLRLYSEHRACKIEDFLAQQSFDSITRRLISAANNSFIQTGKNNRNEILKSLLRIYNKMELDKPIQKMENRLKNKTPVQLLGARQTTELIDNSSKALISFFNSSEGLAALEELLKTLFKLLESLDISLGKISSENLEQQFNKYINILLNDLSKWISNNHQKINDLIDRAVKKSLTAEKVNGSNLQANIKNYIYNSISQKNNISKEFINILHGKKNHNKIQLSQQLLNHLKDKKISDLISLLLNNELIDSKILAKKLQKKTIKYLEQEKFHLTARKISRQKIGQTIKVDLSPLIAKNKKYILELLLEQTVYNKDSNYNISSLLISVLNKINGLSINDIFTENKILNYHKSLISLSREQLPGLKNKLSSIYQEKNKKTIHNLLNPEEIISPLLSQKSSQLLKNSTDIKLSSFLQQLNKIKSSKGIKLTTKKILQDKLPTLLDGKIAKTISDNLKTISDQDIQNILEEFIGRELKPITIFGGVLGSFSASLLFLLRHYLKIGGQFNLGLTVLTYGFIGYLTNVIALKMVFKPYQEKKFFGLKVPFTPGVIAREKKRLAQTLGEFVHQELLNINSINRFFKGKKNEFKVSLVNTIKKDQNHLFQELLHKNLDRISENIIKITYQKRNNICQKSIKLMENTILLTEEINLKKINNKQLNKISTVITEIIEKLLKKSNDFNIETWLLENLDKVVENSFNNINEKTVENILISLTKSFVKKDTKTAVLEKITAQIINSSSFQEKTARFIDKEFNKHLSALTENAVKNIDPSNYLADKLIDFLEIIRQNLKENLRKHNQEQSGLWLLIGKMLNINETLDRTVDILIDEELPELIKEEESNINKKAGEYLTKIATYPPTQIGPILKKRGIMLILKNILSDNVLSGKIINLFKPLVKPTNNTGTKLLKQLMLNLNEDIEFFSKEISSKNYQLKEGVKELSHQLYYTLFPDGLAAELDSIDKDELYPTVRQCLEKLLKSQSLNNFINQALNALLSNNKQSPLINYNYLRKDLSSSIEKIYLNKGKRKEINTQLQEFLTNLIDRKEDFIKEETGNFLLKLAAAAVFESVDNNFIDLVNTIDIHKITVEQVNNMDARKIEKLFYSFAGDYFQRLEVYGWIGGLIGLLTSLF
ncbi:DUF445 family protein [Halocella sp. SP3-1]|uniref:DUF445 family protein n=1 Tax=Halocella sp. SP3-1 TaxID=2382161 RepID=UPI000F752B7B|nr:DUF445 family protein [Halocella sp. SP3-1]AZO94287.1 DUF445 family protein [Halocella sp. SP3-1]